MKKCIRKQYQLWVKSFFAPVYQKTAVGDNVQWMVTFESVSPDTKYLLVLSLRTLLNRNFGQFLQQPTFKIKTDLKYRFNGKKRKAAAWSSIFLSQGCSNFLNKSRKSNTSQSSFQQQRKLTAQLSWGQFEPTALRKTSQLKSFSSESSFRARESTRAKK